MRTAIPISTEALSWLNEVADEEDVRPDLWAHKRFRELTAKMVGQVRLLQARGEVKDKGRVLRLSELMERVPRFKIPEVGENPQGVVVEFGPGLLERLPLVIAWVDYTMPREARPDQSWTDFPTWAVAFLSDQVAVARAALEAKTDEDEETALYAAPPAKKP